MEGHRGFRASRRAVIPAEEVEVSRINGCDVFTISEAAEFLKVSKKTVYLLARQSKLPARKVGREWRFVRHALAAWLAAPEKERRECWEVKNCPPRMRDTCPYYLSVQ